MPRRSIQRTVAALVWAAGALAMFSVASAGVLYRCEGPNGSIAYTNKTATFSKCIELSRYADAAPKPSIAKKTATHATSSAAEPSEEKASTSANGWQYRENVVEKADVKATSFGVASTAMPLRAASFGVESTATLVRTAPVPTMKSRRVNMLVPFSLVTQKLPLRAFLSFTLPL